MDLPPSSGPVDMGFLSAIKFGAGLALGALPVGIVEYCIAISLSALMPAARRDRPVGYRQSTERTSTSSRIPLSDTWRGSETWNRIGPARSSTSAVTRISWPDAAAP